MSQKNNVTIKDINYYKKKFWKLFIYGLGVLILFFTLASWGFFGSMPSFEDLENPESNLATEVFSSDGVTFGKFYNENRTPIKFEDLPTHLVKALVATEDERFYEHSGIDARRTFGAALKLGSDGGASTISQQLAKQLFHGEGSKFILFRVIQKVKEWIIAIKLERQYTKDEIIAMYFNVYDFNNYAIGIRSASKTYFSKEPKDLTIDESAILVGMFKNSSLYNPVRNPQGVKNRRNVVLSQMLKSKIISESQKESLSQLPIKLDFKLQTHKEGIATYFREFLREYMKNWVIENKKPDGTDYDIYTDGLKIYTTIDSKIQQHAEEAIQAHMKNLQQEFFSEQKTNKNAPFVNITDAETKSIIDKAMKNSERWRVMKDMDKSEDEIIASFGIKTKMKIFSWKGELDTLMTPIDSIRYFKHFLQTGVMAMEPQTGHIKAWVGGINYKFFQYDHVGQGARQVGSTFKPFVYATAIEQLGMSPCDSIIDSYFTMPKGKWGIDADWSPKNSDGNYRGTITLQRALANSINTISAKLIDRVGPQAVVDMAKELGVTSKIPVQPSIALGAVDITVEEMVGAMSTFANQGVYVKPTFIIKIEDRNGVVIDQPIPYQKDVVNKDVAYAVIKLMEGVKESGTGARLKYGGGGFIQYDYSFANPVAGKTGTSQNNSDGWFIGMVPNLAAGIWVGNEDRAAHFRSTHMGQGATTALPIWGIFMKKCYADSDLDVSREPFEKPENLSIKVDCWTPKKAIDSTEVLTDEPNMDEFQGL